MERPTRLKVGCFIWTIKWSERIDLENSDMGATITDRCEIWMATKYPLQVQRETLLHEILHVVAHDSFYQRTDGEDQDQAEERMCRLFSPRLMQIFRDNPDVTKFLFGRV